MCLGHLVAWWRSDLTVSSCYSAMRYHKKNLTTVLIIKLFIQKHLISAYMWTVMFCRIDWLFFTICTLSSSSLCEPFCFDCLTSLVVKASTLGAEDPGFESRLQQDFSGSSHTSDLKIGTPVAIQPGAWHYRVSTGTGQPSVSILWLDEIVWSATSVWVWQHVKLCRSVPEIHYHVAGTFSNQ